MLHLTPLRWKKTSDPAFQEQMEQIGVGEGRGEKRKLIFGVIPVHRFYMLQICSWNANWPKIDVIWLIIHPNKPEVWQPISCRAVVAELSHKKARGKTDKNLTMPRNKRRKKNIVLNVALRARSPTHAHSLLCLHFIGLIMSVERKVWISHWIWSCLEAFNKSTNAITTDRQKWAQALKHLHLLSTQSHFTWSIQGTNHSPRQGSWRVIWCQVNGGKGKTDSHGAEGRIRGMAQDLCCSFTC